MCASRRTYQTQNESSIHHDTETPFFVICLLMMHTYVQPMYTEQPPDGEKTSKHCPIDVPFFPQFGSCQRSASNSMQWNQALLLVSH